MKEDPVERLLAHDVEERLPADHEARIREGLRALLVAPSVAPSAPPPAPRSPPTPAVPVAPLAAPAAVTGKMVVGLLLAAAVGGGFAIGRMTAPGLAAYPSSLPGPSSPSVVVTNAPAACVAVPAVSLPPPAASPSIATTSLPPSPGASSTTARGSAAAGLGAAAEPDAFDREQSLLERARNALVRHDAPAAEQALDECDRLFPAPRQAEERDYLRIQVSRERGDTARMREHAQAFLARYPTSLLRGRVSQLLE